jgi:hypothetical protein
MVLLEVSIILRSSVPNSNNISSLLVGSKILDLANQPLFHREIYRSTQQMLAGLLTFLYEGVQGHSPTLIPILFSQISTLCGSSRKTISGSLESFIPL